MAEIKASVILDLNVCQFVAKADNRKMLEDAIVHSFDRKLSPLILLELLNGLAGATTDEHFRKDKAKFLVAAGSYIPDCLPYPIPFVLETILGYKSKDIKQGPEQFALWFARVMSASSLKEVQSHINFENVRKLIDRGKDDMKSLYH
jgi:hypothetical protein